MFIAEVMVSFAHIRHMFCRSVNVTNFCVNDRHSMLPSHWELWGDDLVANVIFVSDQCIDLEINCYNNNFFVAAI